MEHGGDHRAAGRADYLVRRLASTAPPVMPALSPSVEAMIWTSLEVPERMQSRAISTTIAIISSARASITPPPSTTISGLRRLTRLATAMPVYSAASSTTFSTNLSPRRMALRKSPLRKSARSLPSISVRSAVEDQAAANPRAHENAHHMTRFGLQFRHVHPEHGHAAIVLDENGHPQMLFQLLLKGHVAPAQIRRENDAAGFGVHSARSAHADAAELFETEVGLIHGVLHAAGDALDDGVGAALGLGADLGGADVFEGVVE